MRFWLRWRYDFKDGRVRLGMWNDSGKHRTNQAWANSGEGLIRAAIEAKDLATRKIKVAAECDGHNFRNFQWLALSKMPGMMSGTATLTTHNVGLRIMTADTAVDVYIDGQIKKRPLTDGEKNINFATYGK